MIPRRRYHKVERRGGGREGSRRKAEVVLARALSDRRFCWKQSLADIIYGILPTGKTGAEAANQIPGSGKHLGRPG